MDIGGGGEPPPVIPRIDPSNKQPDKKEILYHSLDKGPFIVYLESTDKVGFNIGKSNNIKIARDLFKLNLRDIVKISNKGLNRISVQFTNYLAANSFVNNKTLLDRGYKIFIPFNFVTSKGIARRVDIDLSEEELLKHCNSSGDIKILNVKRMNRKVIKEGVSTYVPTGSVLFTFQGLNLPKYINFYFLEFSVSVYVSPVTQCFRCLRFGHTRNNCRGSKEKCFNCAEDSHQPQGEDFTCETCCMYCKNNHRSTDKRCPEYQRQKNIKQLMAFENYTYFEANELCKRNYTSKGDFVYKPSDFPYLKKSNDLNYSKKNSEDTISQNERRSQHFRNITTKRSYQQVASTESGKRRIIQKGYDKKAHEENLYFPSSRPSKSQTQAQPFSQKNVNIEESELPSSSACSRNAKFPDLYSVIDYLKHTSDLNKDICRELLFSETHRGSYMDLDRESDD